MPQIANKLYYGPGFPFMNEKYEFDTSKVWKWMESYLKNGFNP